MHEDNDQELYPDRAVKGVVGLKPIPAELEDLAKLAMFCQARVDSLYSRLRDVMDDKSEACSENSLHGFPVSDSEPVANSKKIFYQIMRIKTSIQNSIDLMKEIEKRLQL